MTVVPFRRPTPLARHGVVVAIRRDLRTGVTAAGVVRQWDADMDVVDALLTARGIWRDARQSAPLSIAPSPEIYRDAASAGDFAAALQSAEFSPRAIDVEVDETVLSGRSMAGVERLRARGFGIAMAVDPACPLPLSERARSLFTEIVMPAPSRLDPFMGVDPLDMHPMARRMYAAKASGLIVTATQVGDMAWARALSEVGFDRGEGAFAA